MTHVLKFMPTALALVALRVLKPGGRLAIVAETYRGQTFGALRLQPRRGSH
jgi:16S rRNA G1207 methylase RsmC